MLQKIISGGQTGVDRAALDAAQQLNFPHGGWCPHGRIAEDGPIPTSYSLKETPSPEYAERTEWNVRDSDGTLILTQGKPTEGTALTIDFAQKHHKPFLIVDFLKEVSLDKINDWIAQNKIQTLNVAGPRASKKPEIYPLAFKLVRNLLLPGANS